MDIQIHPASQHHTQDVYDQLNVLLSAMPEWPRGTNVTICNTHLLDQQPRHTVLQCSQKSFLLSYFQLSPLINILSQPDCDYMVLWSPSIILLEGRGRALGRENFNLTLLVEVEVIKVLYPDVHHAEKLPDQVIKIWSLLGPDIKPGSPQEYERRDEMQEEYQCTIGHSSICGQSLSKALSGYILAGCVSWSTMNCVSEIHLDIVLKAGWPTSL